MTKFAQTLLAVSMTAGLSTAAHAEGTLEAPFSVTAPVIAPSADMQPDANQPNVNPADANQIELVPVGQTSSIPEPSHLAMYGLAAAGLLYRRFRRPTPEPAS